MIEPKSFAIHVTYTCPLSCAHCCFESSPRNKVRLETERILGVIDALDAGAIELVAFTGGEPFLLGPDLVDVVRRAADRGFLVRVVTSAFFGKTPEAARARLEPLVAAGLAELSISWDDYHEEFVRFECIRNTWRVAQEFGLTVAINTVQAAESRWSRERLRVELGATDEEAALLCESPLNGTGRAARALEDAGHRAQRYLGPCPYVLTGPTLSARGHLIACCGVLPNNDALTIQEDLDPCDLPASLARAQGSALLNALFLRGPYAVLEWLAAEGDVALPPRETFGGNCEACSHLLTDAACRAALEDVLAAHAGELGAELVLLETLGLDDPRGVAAVWAAGDAQLDTAPARRARSDEDADEARAHTGRG